MEFRTVLLRPKGPFRFVPPADTLFGAIASAVAVLYGGNAVSELVDAFKAGARISSAFPYFENTYYLPKPLSVELMEFEGEYEEAKRVKRASTLT